MVCQNEPLVQKVCDLYEQISSLESLKPSKDVDMLFTQLVLTCIPPNPIDVDKLCKKTQEMRSNLIRLCGEAEGLLESHFSAILGHLEFNILNQHHTNVPGKVAFVGSGPLPLTSIVLARNHLTTTSFHNYDIDPSANSKALQLITSHPDLSSRMFFHTTDIMKVTSELQEFDVVFLAALVGMDKEEKVKVVDHLAKQMAPGAILMLRMIDPCDLRGFEVLSVFHPSDEVINSVVIARKYAMPINAIDHQQNGLGSMIVLPNKCCEMLALNPLSHVTMAEELVVEEKHS
ncbi:nicotianamine synthase [Salix suchowensis]|nr:nicotianamine synthase [Salix suchowensis]